MLKWYNIYKEIWYQGKRIGRFFIQEELYEEEKIDDFRDSFIVKWDTIEKKYKENSYLRGTKIWETEKGYVIAFDNKVFSLNGAEKLIIKQQEDLELNLEVRYREEEEVPSFDSIIYYPNKEKVAQWLREQGIAIRE